MEEAVLEAITGSGDLSEFLGVACSCVCRCWCEIQVLVYVFYVVHYLVEHFSCSLQLLTSSVFHCSWFSMSVTELV